MVAGEKPRTDGCLSIGAAGRHGADRVVMFKLWPILDALKVKRCGLHAFRHFHTSMLLEVGAPPQVAQAQLRHSDARITLDVYSHVIGDSQRNAVGTSGGIVAPQCAQVTGSREVDSIT